MKENRTSKKPYEPPKLLAAATMPAANSVCGWYTQCGRDVKSRK